MTKKLLSIILTLAMLCGMAAAAAAEGRFVPGTYEAEAQGFGGYVRVWVTVTDSIITDVDIDAPNETPGIGGQAVEILPMCILEAQSTQVDAVSGATITGKAILSAVSDALKQAATAAEPLRLVTDTGSDNASDSEFKLRDGIFFGDDLETVKSKVALTLTIQNGSRDKTDMVWFDGTITGRSGSVRFDFDQSTGMLYDMVYTFNYPDTATQDDHYQTLYEGLVHKYGPAIGLNDGTVEPITGGAIDHAAVWISLWRSINGDGNFTKNDEWIVDCGSYKVKIDLIAYYAVTSGGEYFYTSDVSYRRFTDEEYEEAVRKNQETDRYYENDL